MHGIRTLLIRLRTLVRRGTKEREMAEELRFHLDMEADLHRRGGLPPEDARLEALRRFGGVARTADECRDSWGVRQLDQLRQDVRFALRGLRRNPGFSAVVILTLALGIGANTAIFSVVDTVLFRALPYQQGDRLVRLKQVDPQSGIDNDMLFSVKEIADYRTQRQLFDAVAEYHSMWFNLLGDGDPLRVQTGVVSANFFDVMGIRPVLGRSFAPDDDRPGAPPVLLLSYSFWQDHFAGATDVLGRTVRMNDRSHVIVGVLPPIPGYPDDNDVYMPTSACPFRSSQAMITNRQAHMMDVFARVKAGVPLQRVDNDLATFARHLAQEYPDAYKQLPGFTANATPLRDELTHGARLTFLILLGAAGFILLLVCANVANLMLARMMRREHELAIRNALGAGRGRIARQLLTESAVLAVAGGVAGVLLALAARSLLVAFASRFTPLAPDIAIDGQVLTFALIVSLVTGILFGIGPAWPAHRQPVSALKDGGRTMGGDRRMRTRNLLVAVQVAVSFVLLIGAGLMVRSLIALEQVRPGFNPEHVLTFEIDLDWVKYRTAASRAQFFDRTIEGLRALPGAEHVAVSSSVPLDQTQQYQAGFQIAGRPPAAGQALPQADYFLSGAGYFRTIGTPIVAGRDFTADDRPDTPAVAIVNASMARHYWPDTGAVGQRISFDSGQHWITVVGVVGDVRQYGLAQQAADTIYRPFFQLPGLVTRLFVRTPSDPLALIRQARAVVKQVDPDQPVSHVQTLEQVRSASLAPPRLLTALISLFALLALVVTAAGIAGVVAFSVSQRTTEIGIRMALGAEPRGVIGMVVRQGLAPVLAGLAIGIVGAMVFSRLMNSIIFGVTPTDPLTFFAVAGVLMLSAGLACLQPARRAASVDPIQALRSE